MALSPAMDAALQDVAPLICGLVEIDLPGYPLRLLDGSGTVAYGGKTFVGRDPTYGVLAAIDEISDGAGDEAPALRITLHPSSNASAAALAAPTMQGCRVSVSLAALDRMTGQVIGEPELLFLGELDVPTLKSGPNSRTLEYEVVSVFERLFDNDEGARLSSAFHKSIWPGERGFDFVTGVEDDVYWGVEGPPSAVTYGAGGGGGGGGRTVGKEYLR